MKSLLRSQISLIFSTLALSLSATSYAETYRVQDTEVTFLQRRSDYTFARLGQANGCGSKDIIIYSKAGKGSHRNLGDADEHQSYMEQAHSMLMLAKVSGAKISVEGEKCVGIRGDLLVVDIVNLE